MKKVAAFCLMVMLTLSVFAGNALAFTEYTGATQYTGNVGPYAVMLLDANSGTILYKKNIDEQIEPASTTKIMTCLLAVESGKLDEEVQVSSKAAGQGGSLLHVAAGEKLKLKDLNAGMMMASGNDAAVAIAEFLGGSVDGFADMMNNKAAELGMTNSHFTVPHGMHAEGHHSTARDMAALTFYAMQNPQFAEIVKRASYSMPADNKHSSTWEVENTNKLLQPDEQYYYQYATGIKTGSTPAAGDCLISSASKDGMNLICLVFKDEYNGSARWPLSKDLFEWGFANFKTVDLATLMEKAEPVQATVEGAAASDSGVLEFNSPEVGTTYVTLDKASIDGILNGTDSIETETVFDADPLQAPIAKDDIVGTVSYKSASTGTVLYQGNLIASRDVPKVGSDPDATGSSAVQTQTPVAPVEVVKPDSSAVWWLLLIPGVLIALLVVRLTTVNRRKRKRFKHRQPHYSYKIKR